MLKEDKSTNNGGHVAVSISVVERYGNVAASGVQEPVSKDSSKLKRNRLLKY